MRNFVLIAALLLGAGAARADNYGVTSGGSGGSTPGLGSVLGVANVTSGHNLVITTGDGLAFGTGTTPVVNAIKVGAGLGTSTNGFLIGPGDDTLVIRTPNDTGAGFAYDVTVFAGSAAGGTGAYIDLYGGTTTQPDVAELSGGSGIGTNVRAGGLNLKSGGSTGTGAARIYLMVPPKGTTGAGANTPTTYVGLHEGGNFVLNDSGSALSTAATDGFTHIPTFAGTPTGTPTSFTGAAAIGIDTTNNLFNFRSGGAWKQAATIGGSPSFASVTVTSGLTLTGATITGTPTWSSSQAITLSTAAQPNVTSLGTLTGVTLATTGQLLWGTDAAFARQGAAGIVGLVRADSLTSPAAFRVYNTTDAAAGAPTNAEWIETICSANVFKVQSNKSGSGTERDVWLTAGAAGGIVKCSTSGSLTLTGNTISSVGDLYLIGGAFKIKYYANVGTAGYGVPAIYGQDFRQGRTSADGATTTLYTAANGTSAFRVDARIFATAYTSGTATYTITWTEHSTTQTIAVSATVINTPAFANTIIVPDNGTNITCQLTGTFTATVTVVANVEELK